MKMTARMIDVARYDRNNVVIIIMIVSEDFAHSYYHDKCFFCKLNKYIYTLIASSHFAIDIAGCFRRQSIAGIHNF